MKKIVFWLTMILCFITAFLFNLKIGFNINIEWWAVFSPLWVPVAIIFLILIIILTITLIQSLNRKIKQKEDEDIVIKGYRKNLSLNKESRIKRLFR